MFERLLRRPADQPPHAADVSNVQSKPGRPHVVKGADGNLHIVLESKKAGVVQTPGIFLWL